MRYEKADNLVQLALEMQARRMGMTLGEIEERFNVGRRTAMRMRDAVIRNFPQAEEVSGVDRLKRWRIPAGTVDGLVNFKLEEIADLESAAQLLRQENQPGRAENLENLVAKLKSLMKGDAIRRIEPDLDALMEAEGIAMRPGPRPKQRPEITDGLRYAIKACVKVQLHYRNRRTKRLNKRLVHPYGFLHGHRHYLVAFHENPKANKVALFSLPNIEAVEPISEMFERDPLFNLHEFAARSFGVFQEEPFNVVWKFSSEAAIDAADFEFHPSQTHEWRGDGSLIVRFRAGSDLEMAWHLYQWGEKVEVLEPRRLADLVHPRRFDWLVTP